MKYSIPATIFLVIIIMGGTYFSHLKSTDIKLLANTVLNQKKQIFSLQNKNTELKKHISYLKKTLKDTRVLYLTVTAYSPRKHETDSDPFITASMQPVREGGVAVSRDLFYAGWVFGREVYIEGYGIFVIADLMHKRKTNQIDIFRFNTKDALKFGRKTLRVALLN
jgi:3D (Asp-Asp-Asp) domain-containing protein